MVDLWSAMTTAPFVKASCEEEADPRTLFSHCNMGPQHGKIYELLLTASMDMLGSKFVCPSWKEDRALKFLWFAVGERKVILKKNWKRPNLSRSIFHLCSAQTTLIRNHRVLQHVLVHAWFTSCSTLACPLYLKEPRWLLRTNCIPPSSVCLQQPVSVCLPPQH